MQPKTSLVIACIISFLVVMDLLQVRWLYATYQDRKSQYQQTLTSLLRQAADQYRLVIGNHSPKDSLTYYVVASTNNRLSYESSEHSGIKKIVFYSKALIVDSVNANTLHLSRPSSTLEPPFEQAVFDSIFKTTLKQNIISSPYRIDTFRRPPVVGYSTGEALQNQDRGHDEYPITTVPVRINNNGSLYIYASFRDHPPFQTGKFLWAFVINLVIFITSNIVMFYVLVIIRKQKKLHEIKNDFINNMTHELRTPIAVATTAIDAILHHHGMRDAEKARFYLETSRLQLMHLDQMVEKILSIATEESKDMSLRYETLNLKDVFTTLMDNTLLTASKPVHFHFNGEQADIPIRADKMHLANALNNLIDNAVKFSRDPAHIDIRCYRTDNQVILEIKDNGQGIPKEYQSSIFEPFFRIPQGDLHDVKGFGLGLSYVKTVIEKHHGTVEVDSSLHEGTTFTITLPIDERYEA